MEEMLMKNKLLSIEVGKNEVFSKKLLPVFDALNNL